MKITPGQVWETRDKRAAGRRLRVIRLFGLQGVVLTDARVTTARVTMMMARTLRSRFRLVSQTLGLALLLAGCASVAPQLERSCRLSGGTWTAMYDSGGDVKAYSCTRPPLLIPDEPPARMPKGAM